MPTTAQTLDPVEKTAEEVVGSAFDGIDGTPGSEAIPELVFLNRQKRAQRRLVDALVSRGSSEIPDDLAASVRTLAKQWAGRGFEDGFAAVEAFEIEAAEEREQLEAERSGDRQKILEVAEQRHRRHIEKQFGKIELRGLQVSERVFQSLDMAYVPLHVSDPEPAMLSELTAGLKEAGLETGELETSGFEKLFQPRAEVLDILSRFDSTLIIGGPGSGKTTLVSYLATLSARGELDLPDVARSLVPLVITIRSLRDPELSLGEIARLQSCTESFVEAILKDGRALVLVDGIDETPQGRLVELQQHLNEFRKRFPKNRFVVTSRPSDRLDLGADWAETHLQRLTSEEVDTFVDRWCLAAEISLQKDPSSAESDARRAADDLKTRISKSKAIRQLAETPLLATILCVVHRFLGFRIPERRVALYEACTNVLLYEWDAAKFPEGRAIGRLDAQQKRALLATIAYRMHVAEISQMPAEEIIEVLDSDLPKLGEPKVSGRELLEDIRDRSGLLVEREAGLYGFSHLTFQEYLAASKVVREELWEDILVEARSPWWHEVIVLSGGFPNSKSDFLVRRLLDLEDSAELGVILAARVAETAVELSRPIREDLQDKLEEIVPPRNIEQLQSLAVIGEACTPLLADSLYSGKIDAPSLVWTLTALAWMEESSVVPLIEEVLEAARSEPEAPQTGQTADPDKLSKVDEAAGILIATLFFKASTWPLANKLIERDLRKPKSILAAYSPKLLRFLDSETMAPESKALIEKAAQVADESSD